MSGEELLQCYNRGCGEKYKQSENKEDSCRHHPGDPVFHDAYKGWSCCNKKCIDFTEFLNIKGCTLSKHSNIKPVEPEKPKNNVPDHEIIEVKPLILPKLKRPPIDLPMVTMVPELAPSLKQQLSTNIDNSIIETAIKDFSQVTIGTICKNGGCNVSYNGLETESSVCAHHPGTPIFHEGMKYWSCCQKKTSDFNVFLNQVGCKHGKHVWVKEDSDFNNINCRWDHHQTGTHVIVSIYAKQYCPMKSIIKLNPIRLYANLVFPQQANANFNLDIELRGIIDVQASQVSMYGTKIEIKLKKAEPGSWSDLNAPKRIIPSEQASKDKKMEEITPRVDAVDLSDI